MERLGTIDSESSEVTAGTRRQKDVDMKSNDVYRLEFDFISMSFWRRVAAGVLLKHDYTQLYANNPRNGLCFAEDSGTL